MKRTLRLSFIVSALVVTIAANAQVIVETFENPAWTTAATITSATSTYLTMSTNSSTSTNQTISTYSAVGATGGTITTVAPQTNSGPLTWFYSRASLAGSGVASGNRKHSADNGLAIAGTASVQGFLISPIIQHGITSVSFWGAPSTSANITNMTITVGFNSNTTAPNAWTIAQSDPGAVPATDIKAFFSLNTSTFSFATTLNATNTQSSAQTTGNQQFSVAVTNASAKQFIIMTGNAGPNLWIDDIVVNSPPPFPITFTTVSAAKAGSGVNVNWGIATETASTEKYIVERSADGANFLSVGSILPSGLTKYTYFDANPVSGKSNYYRIKSMSRSGQPEYSAISRINLQNGVAPVLTIASNPIRNGLITYQLNDFEKGSYVISVINSAGQVVYSGNINHDGGSVTQNIQLSSATRSGTYYLQVKGEAVSMTKALLLQE
jgi:hypothetical protein